MKPPEDIHLFVPTYRIDECLAQVRECLERGWTGLGFKTVAFEASWRAYTGLPHAHMVSSCTAGLELALQLFRDAEGWNLGDEIVSTPLTFVSTNHAIVRSGLVPIFADVDDTLTLDPASVEERLTPRTRAVLFVGLGGNPGRLSDVSDLCRKRGLKLILDAAHMAGTRVAGIHVGHEADAAVYSFQAVKNLPTADSGMLCLSDGALDAKARKWSWCGISKDTYSRTLDRGDYRWRYEVEAVGMKCHGNSVMAALGMVGLKYLDRDNAWRRQIAKWYYEKLHLFLPGGAFPVFPEDTEPSRHLYQILHGKRDSLMAHLNAARIYPGVHYESNTRHGPYRAQLGRCPRAETAATRLLSLPIHLRMGLSEVERIADTIRSFESIADA